jgi:hypothetical protein
MRLGHFLCIERVCVSSMVSFAPKNKMLNGVNDLLACPWMMDLF